MKKIRRHFVFYGRVQGVGFRFRARSAARYFGLSGFVRNLPDGSVELEYEGTEEAIDRAVLSIEEGHFIEITNAEIRDIPPEGDYDFHVR